MSWVSIYQLKLFYTKRIKPTAYYPWFCSIIWLFFAQSPVVEIRNVHLRLVEWFWHLKSTVDGSCNGITELFIQEWQPHNRPSHIVSRSGINIYCPPCFYSKLQSQPGLRFRIRCYLTLGESLSPPHLYTFITYDGLECTKTRVSDFKSCYRRIKKKVRTSQQCCEAPILLHE